jgi:hypothetical protein
VVVDHAGLDDLVRRIGHAADDPLGRHRPRKLAAWIEPREPRVVPPGNAVLHEYHRRVAPEERRALLGEGGKEIRLERHEDRVVRSKLACVRCRPHAAHDRLLAVQQLQAAALHRFEMRAAGHHRDIVSCGGELRRDVPADRAGAEDAQFHADRIPRHENLPLQP